MARDSLFQVRMDSEIKRAVEELYSSMGTSFAEAVRIFATQSLIAGGMPFQIKAPAKHAAMGSLQDYADLQKIDLEENAWANAVIEKYEKAD